MLKMFTKHFRRKLLSHSDMHTLVAYIVVFLINKVSTAGNFELELLEISNTNSHLMSGYCCGVPLEIRSTRTTDCPPCSTAFRLCLKEYQSSAPESFTAGCSFGNSSTGILGGSSFVLSDPGIGAIVLPFTFRWTKSFTLILQALDMYNTSYPDAERLIEEATFSGVILPSPEWKTLDHIGKNARITYRVRVQCAVTYYNTTCTTFCRPRNDQFGHHTCGSEGQKVCLNGWQGVNCEKAICKPGCDPTHGKCEQPGACECRPGWRGPLCNECMVYPGCKHGSCNGIAWQCLCDTNWGGILCDQDLNYCGTHEPCMHGGTCENTAPDQYRCTCAEGLSGERCEIVEHPCATQPCKNGGTCTLKESQKMTDSMGMGAGLSVRGMRGMSSMGKPVGRNRNPTTNGGTSSGGSAMARMSPTTPPVAEFTCTCAPGWTGPTCEINIDECAGGPCEHGGTCIDLVGGFRCECPPEWTGDICQMDVNECESNSATNLGPCINAEKCHNLPGSFSCQCLKGWGGPTCAKDLDDCKGQCKNGATCIDLVNDYHCACATGYTGRDCETDINECAKSPCRNNGECVDMIGKFKCICPLGYSGSLCEEAKDHCTPSPCIQGSCLNTPGGYYCHCPPDHEGKHCENMRPLCSSPHCNESCTPPITNSTQFPAFPCSGHGNCENGDVGTYCKCHPGRTGTYCEHNLNECSPNPCRNGGICLDGEGDFTCECISGWTGKRCSERATQCYAGQCQNGGTCVTADGGTAQCRCAPGWNGQFCSEAIDQCQGQPCHNGGTCESGSGWFRCLCAQGFSGPDCRINVNECSPQPCLGGARCIDGIGGYTCVCPPGRQGVRCEISLSDPQSACLNITTLSPYNSLINSTNVTTLPVTLEESCNACTCVKGKRKCTNLWCGLPNCVGDESKFSNSSIVCQSHEVCVPSLRESCLSPPCSPRGDCRELEPSRRVAPPKLPAKSECWPNQAVLNENCARLTILVELERLSKGTSVESLCSTMRLLLAGRMVNEPASEGMLILICDLKTSTNDTIEVTLSSTKVGDAQLPLAIKLLGELLSRQSGISHSNQQVAKPSLAPLISILEVKVETALVTKNSSSSGLLFGILCGIGIVLIGFAIFMVMIWKQKTSIRTTSGINLTSSLDALRHEEEKSNNLQNEEMLKRYTNPLKGSTSSLRANGMELSLNPAPELASIPPLAAGPSSLHHSQPIYPPCESNFDHELDSSSKAMQQKRSSQILLHKTQNSDMKKNTVGSLDSPRKDFGKRSINCKSAPPITGDPDVLTVHV
ncbi:protein serrate [Eupeodes corollae]|uniref:protein serrate n=1 Tax=Eupeodes corollae TaxID=290404 RepID=UPI00249008E1|nr:protein serrate [Eupeodes corollae]